MAARWKLIDKMIYISLGLILLFAYFDSRQVIGIKAMDSITTDSANHWNIYWSTISPANFMLWIGAVVALSLAWYLYSRDKSEAVALAAVPSILIYTGLQDIIYYIISPDTLADVGCWADVMLPVRLVSDFLGEACPTGKSLLISAALGSIAAYYAYNHLKKAKW